MIKVGVIFGGRSTESEISVITALGVMNSLDQSRFNITPVYIDNAGVWWTGDALKKRSFYPIKSPDELTRVALTCESRAELKEVKNSWHKIGRDKTFSIDVWFPTFHGTFGEDGCMQGVFEINDLPYVGSGVLASSVGMNKVTAKRLFVREGLPVLPHIEITKKEWNPAKPESVIRKVLDRFKLPLIIKPVNLGSSVGLSKAASEDDLAIGIAGALAFDPDIMIEPLVSPLYELNCAVREGDPPIPSAVERPKAAKNGLLTFEQKYMSGAKKLSLTKGEGMASAPRDVNPSDVPADFIETVRSYSVKAYETLGCKGIARVDFLVNSKTSELFINEINTIPGSFAYYLWDATEPRVPFTEILTGLIEGAVKRNETKRANRILPTRSVLG